MLYTYIHIYEKSGCMQLTQCRGHNILDGLLENYYGERSGLSSKKSPLLPISRFRFILNSNNS